MLTRWNTVFISVLLFFCLLSFVVLVLCLLSLGAGGCDKVVPWKNLFERSIGFHCAVSSSLCKLRMVVVVVLFFSDRCVHCWFCCWFFAVRSLLFVLCCSFIVVRSLLLSFSEINRHCSSMLCSQTQQTPTPTQKEYYQHSHLLSTAASSLCGSSQPPPRHFTATLLNSREVSQIMHILFHQPLAFFWDNTALRTFLSRAEEGKICLYCTCWWYSLCNFQYRQQYENTCSYNFDCWIYTHMYFFIFIWYGNTMTSMINTNLFLILLIL